MDLAGNSGHREGPQVLPDSGTPQSPAEEGRGLEDLALKERSPAEARSRQTPPPCGPERAQTRGDGPQEGRSVWNRAEFGSGRCRVLETDEGTVPEPRGQRDGKPRAYVLVQQNHSLERRTVTVGTWALTLQVIR